MNAICNDCKKEMKPKGGCSLPYLIDKDKKRMKRNVCDTDVCHDCNAGNGKIHHFGCDSEYCPQCGQQVIGCDCEWEYVSE